MPNIFRALSVLLLLFCAFSSLGQNSRKPNILFCIADDASYQHMSAYGITNWVHTPNFDRVAAEGLLFTKAYTPNAKCSPSRAAILTGRNPWQLEAAGNHNPYFPAKYTTFMEVLDQNNYYTGFTGKGWGPGEVGMINGTNRELTGKTFNANKRKITPTKAISANDYAANFAQFLKEKPAGQPFAFWMGSHEPHRPYRFQSAEHQTDKADGAIDGVPENLLSHAYTLPWLKLIHEEMREISEGKSDINPYALVNEAEFLAVAAEYFFERPERLQSKHPELYELMTKIFKQDLMA